MCSGFYEPTRKSLSIQSCHFAMPPEINRSNLDQPPGEDRGPRNKNPSWKRLKRRVMWQFYARYPRLFRHPDGWDEGYHRAKDVEDNDRTSLDENVRLKLGCIMVSEIFGPNEVDALYQGLERFGWDRDRFREQSNVDWLKKQRLYGTEGTLPIGWVHRPEQAKKGFTGLSAPFPKEFSALLVNIAQLTPSVTCLSVGFVLTDESSLDYASEIDRPAQTTVVPQKDRKAVSILSAFHVKEERVRRVRDRFRSVAIDWLSENFSGYFSRNCSRSRFPTAEFISLEGFTPFDTAARADWQHWSRFVHVDRDFGSWTCSSAPSLRFTYNSDDQGRTPNHMVIALRWDALNEKDTRVHGEDALTSRTYYAHERLSGIIARSVLVDYLREVLRSLKETRQSLTPRRGGPRSGKAVAKINDFFRRSIGVPSIAREVLKLADNDASFRWNATGFTQENPLNKDKAYEIKDALKSMLKRMSLQLIEEDRDTREYLVQLSSAIGTKESIATQRRMEILTYAALAVAILSLLVALFGARPG
jgi:hypothetical protein